jgi:hypothetical protein
MLTFLPATAHGVLAPHTPPAVMLAGNTTGVLTAASNVEVTKFPLEPAAAKEGAVLVAPAVSNPFDPKVPDWKYVRETVMVVPAPGHVNPVVQVMDAG